MTTQELIQGLEQYSPEQRLQIIQGMQKDGVKVDGLDLKRPPEQILSIIDNFPKSAKVSEDNEAPESSAPQSTEGKTMSATEVFDAFKGNGATTKVQQMEVLKRLADKGVKIETPDRITGQKKTLDLSTLDFSLSGKKKNKLSNSVQSALYDVNMTGINSSAGQLATGGVKSVAQTATGLASLAGKGVEKISNATIRGLNKVTGSEVPETDKFSALDKFRDEKLSYKTPAEKVGGAITDIATLFTGGGAAAKLAGKAEKAASFVQKGKRLTKLSGLEAGATGAYSAAKEGELNSKVATDAALAGGLTFGLGSVFGTGKKALSWLAEPKDSKAYRKAVEALEKGGVDERSINILKNLDDSGKKSLMKYVDATKRRLSGDITEKGAMDEAAKEVNAFFETAKATKSEMGRAVKEGKNKFLKKAFVDTRESRGAVQKLMSEMGVKFQKGGKINFSESVLDVVPEAKRVFLDILEKTKGGKANALTMKNLVSKINAGTKIMKAQGLQVDQFTTAIGKAKSSINKSIYKVAPEYEKIEKPFAKFAETLKPLRSAGKVSIGDGKEIFNARQILSRSLGNASGKPDAAIESINALRKSFGLKGAKNLPMKAELASIAERMTGDVKPQSLEGVVSQVGSMAANSVPGGNTLASAFKFAKNLKKAKKGTELLSTIARTPTKPKPQPIVNFLKKKLTGAGSKVIIPSAIAGLFAKKD